MHWNTKRTRLASYQAVLESERQGSNEQRLELVGQIQQVGLQPTTVIYCPKQIYDVQKVLGQTEKELDKEEDEKQERTLLEEIEHERSNVEQRIPSHVGVLSPGLSHLEFSQPLNGIHFTQSQSSIETGGIFYPFLQYSRTPTEVVEVQKAQQDVTNAEEVARLLDPFNIGRVNKQSKSSLSLQEVVYNPEEYKQSPERDMSSSIVSPHQDVPTLGNLGQTESSEVQTLSSADEEHEAPMIKENETEDS
ncbi:MAG: hypothetical protein EZS28_013778 [Streblomastix strix]|uniref:Uncharacterized protein n=1 Tax=Streblomastix strix TaxID=222440 RepID=A0A5J4W7S2_9EUKA|nr:MAG: hypothetical protein EZS28_013778 [Streblomastix strix]